MAGPLMPRGAAKFPPVSLHPDVQSSAKEPSSGLDHQLQNVKLWICEHLNISCSEPLFLQQEGGKHSRCSVNNTGCYLNQHCLQLKPESPPQSKDSLENQEICLPQLLNQTQDPKTQHGEVPVQAAVNLLPEPAQAPFLK